MRDMDRREISINKQDLENVIRIYVIHNFSLGTKRERCVCKGNVTDWSKSSYEEHFEYSAKSKSHKLCWLASH